MSDLSLEDLYFECNECSKREEDVIGMTRHILEAHPEYTPQEAEAYATNWAESAVQEANDEQDIENSWRAEEFRRTGHDPFDESWDDPS